VDSAPAPSQAPIRVLICDDVEGLRRLLRSIIELDTGLCVVGEASDGNEALSQARELQPDVIVLDLSMPERTGLNALPDIRIAAPNAAVIAYTGLAGDVVESAARQAGATHFLQKGTDPASIVNTINQAHRSKTSPGDGTTGPRLSGVQFLPESL
jgi:DNA-binding NarL/FixJ family response regulator